MTDARTLGGARLRHARNPRADPAGPVPEAARRALAPEEHRAAVAEITAWPGCAPTPLVPLPGLAQAAVVGSVLCKDEARRFALGSFKALGGAYAVLRVLQARLGAQGVEASARDLIEGRHAERLARETVACATDWQPRAFGRLGRAGRDRARRGEPRRPHRQRGRDRARDLPRRRRPRA